jgi:hypothetical protein
MIKKITVFSIAAFLLSCASDYYARSVEKARKKAVEELPLLSEADKFEIKFGKPEIMRRRILSRSGNSGESKNDVYHSWIVWHLPDSAEDCVVVSGVSEGRMNDWTPEHVIVRKVEKIQEDFKNNESKKSGKK